MLWPTTNNGDAAEINDCYWQTQQQPQQQLQQPQQHYQEHQHQHQQQLQYNHCNKAFIVPGDIPPPPPQPMLKNGIKRFVCERTKQQQQQQQQQQELHQLHQQPHSQLQEHSPYLGDSSFDQTYDLPQQQHQQQQQQQQQQKFQILPQQNVQHHQHHHHQYVHNQQQLAVKQQQTPQHHTTKQQQQQHCQQHNHLQQPPSQQQQQQKHYQHCLLRNPELQQQHQQQQQQQHQHQQYQHSNLQQQHFKYHSNLSLKEQQEQNLFYSEQKIRRLRIILGTIFAIVVIALLATAIVFIVKGDDEPIARPSKETNTIQLEDVLSGHLAPLDLNATWSGTELMYRDSTDWSIVSYDVKTRTRKIVMRDALRLYTSFQKSADGKYLLLAKLVQKSFRYSFTSFYDIYDLTTGEFHPLLHAGEQRRLWLVKWAPVGNALIFNYAGNLYYKRSALKDSEVVAITNDASPSIVNGIPDWIYEEEVLSSNTAVWFNPNGSQIAFIQFDNSATYYMNIQEYGEAGDLRFQYPLIKRVPYPKPGSPNPRIKLFTADLTRVGDGSDTHLTDVPVPSALNTEADYLIVGVLWLNNDLLLSTWMNRIQNQLHMQVYNGLRRYQLLSMESKTGWVSIFETPYKNRDGSIIALILPQRQGNDGNYRHLCLLPTRNQNEEPEALTKGKFEVQSILHWDQTDNVIFYTANMESHAEVLHIFAVKASGTDRSSKCLTCDLHVSGDIKQSYYSAEFNTDNQVVITSNGPGVPMTDIHEWNWSSNQITLKPLMDWESNKRVRTEVAKLAMPQVEIHSIPMTNGFTAKVLLHLPPNMDRSGKTKYPMLVEVYGGPDSYSVVNRFNMDWGMYLTSNQSVIYAKIDGRGSGLRGEQLLHSIYLKLGTLEIEDQINVARQLQQKFSFIDAEHTGIWGWSYGGYASAMALANDESKVFRCAASIAPVTDWAYYDSIYTERYMSLPKLNEAGYNISRLTTRASRLRGKKYMLIHGTLDDNVHYQQALVLAKNLERLNILFKQISYTDEDHGLFHVRPHLYHSLDNFFGDCFDRQSLMRSRK